MIWRKVTLMTANIESAYAKYGPRSERLNMSLIVEKIRKNDAFDSQRTAALRVPRCARPSSFRRGRVITNET